MYKASMFDESNASSNHKNAVYSISSLNYKSKLIKNEENMKYKSSAVL